MSDEGRARRKEPWDMTGPELIEALATSVLSGATMKTAQAREVQAMITAWQDAAASDHAHAQRQAERAEQAEARVAKLEAEAQEHEASFALYDDACRRGTALWRAADPEHRQMVLPDTAALVAWLLERLGERDLALGQIAADLKASWYGCTGPRAAGQDERLVAERLAAYENALAIVETARAALRGEGREGTGCTDNCYQCQCPDGR